MNDLIGKEIERKQDEGDWQDWGTVETEQEAEAISEVLKMGSHGIMGGHHIVTYRIKES